MREIFLPPGVQARLHQRLGACPREAEDYIADRIDALWRLRNQTIESRIAELDYAMADLAADGHHEISVRAIDVGVDLRLHDMAITIPPYVTHVHHDGAEIGEELTAAGTHAEILEALAAAGYDNIVCDWTANGRNIWYTHGQYHVQPWNDNYVMRVGSLAEAHDAYLHPENYR